MLFYFSVITITTLLTHLSTKFKKRQGRIFFDLGIIFSTLVSGLRGVGTDYNMYSNNYHGIIDSNFKYVDYYSVMVQLYRMMGKAGIDVQICFIITSFFTILIAFKIIYEYKDEINITFAVFSYMTSFYLMSFNTFRQILAAELFLLASIRLFKNKSIKKFWVYFIIACLIHTSILPFVVILGLKKKLFEQDNQKLRMIVYIIVALTIALLPSSKHLIGYILSHFGHYAWYITRFEYKPIGIGAIRYLSLAIMPVIVLKISNKKYTKAEESSDKLFDEGISYIQFYLVLGTILWFSSYVTSSSMYRVSYNMLISMPLMHGLLLKNCAKRFHDFKLIALVFCVFIFLIAFCYYDCVILNSGEIYPYRWFWRKN